MEELVLDSDESTYDWILSHQLLRIMQGWEDMIDKDS
jgi:hypothetical protein